MNEEYPYLGTWFFVWNGYDWVLDPEAQCTATTRDGRRCRNPVFIHGTEWDYRANGWHETGQVDLDSPEVLRRALELLCPLHLAMLDQKSQQKEESVP